MRNLIYYLRKISQGIILSLVLLTIICMRNFGPVFAEFALHETIPGYNVNPGEKMFFKISPTEAAPYAETWQHDEVRPEENSIIMGNELIRLDDIIYQPETDFSAGEDQVKGEKPTVENLDLLRDQNYLRQNFYTVDSRTGMTEELFDVDKFLEKNLSINKATGGPKVLIFHTHAHEMFADSAGVSEGVIACGQRLAEILEDRYGIESIHNYDDFNVEKDGSNFPSAYERMEPVISQIIKENPTIEVAIDIHRDAVKDESYRIVKNINGKPTAPIMFFNGLCKLMQNGQLIDIGSLPNPYLDTNLAFSFQMQLAANRLYPDFTRKVYLNAYRYSLNMLPKSLLVEVGFQTNTKEEALNAMEYLADVLAEVVDREA